MTPSNSRIVPVAGLLMSLTAPAAILLLPPSPPRLLTATILVCFLPGWALVEGLFAVYGKRPSLVERLLLGAASSYVVTVIAGLWLYYALGQLTLSSLLAVYTLVGVLGFSLAIIRGKDSDFPGTINIRDVLGSVHTWVLFGLLALSAYFCFYFLSYSDFRGDEAEVVLRAVSAVRGQGDPIFSHTKGPAETLLTASMGLLYGAFGELTARLPFALASWLVVVSIYLLGRSLFGRRVALIGTALMVVNGWLVSHSRTAQYQTLLLLMSILALWSFYRFYQTRSHTYVVLGTFFLTMAILAHYDGAAAVLPVLYLLGVTVKQPHKRSRQSQLLLGGLLLAGVAVLLSFYVPFYLSPTIGDTQGYLSKFFADVPPHNNWEAFYINGLFYNSIYYVLGMGGVLLLGTLYGIRCVLVNRPWSAVAAVGALPFLLLSWTGLLPPWYALLVYVGLMGLFLFSPRIGLAVKIMLLWMFLPFGLYLFIVVRPGNHFYVFMPPLMLLAALTLDRGLRWLEGLPFFVRRWAVPTIVGVLLALYGLSAWYAHLVFMRTDLEYMLTYPKHRNSIFWSDPRYPFDIRIGWGFPYRLGWQTVSELYRSGQLAGDWYGNDENNSIFWYTLGWPRNPCYPRYFMLTEIGYSDPPLEVPWETIENQYALRAVVQVNGQSRLRLYEFAPLGSDAQPIIYNEPTRYTTPYHREMLGGDPSTGPVPSSSLLLTPSRRFKPHPDMLAHLADVYDDPRIVQVQDEASLLGYNVDDTWAVPGGVILLTLYWQADRGLVFPYKVFAHLEDTQLWAQADDEPGCSRFPTYLWRAGELVLDRHAIFLPDDLPPGSYALQVGLYETRTGLRMDVLDDLGNPAGNAVTLPAVTVRSAD